MQLHMIVRRMSGSKYLYSIVAIASRRGKW